MGFLFNCSACDHRFTMQDVPPEDGDKPMSCPKCGSQDICVMKEVVVDNVEVTRDVTGLKDQIRGFQKMPDGSTNELDNWDAATRAADLAAETVVKGWVPPKEPR